MADTDALDAIQAEEQLWNELDKIVATECHADDHEAIDDALRNWLYLASKCRNDFALSEDDVASCSQSLLLGRLFHRNPEYVRTQIIYSLLQEDEAGPLYAIASFLLLDGRREEATYKRMVDETCFHRLLELIDGRKEHDPGLHRLLLELMYEMSRIERLRVEDLLHVDDGFVTYLFQLIEGLSDDVHDPYHYPVIRVLLVLNEQYMVASTTSTDPQSPATALTNRVVKCLSLYGPNFRTFGENIILLLNRETETSLQLLILKLLYLLFTTKATYEYFYTNDLRVLLDVIIRNLCDLPSDFTALRHTYLRVLYPLLAHTQLNQPPHYKKDEINKVLKIQAGSGNTHFDPADETTLRLVNRVSQVKWLLDEGTGTGEVARRFLGISLSPTDAASNISVVDVAAVTEKPGVKTPSRKAEFGTDADVLDQVEVIVDKAAASPTSTTTTASLEVKLSTADPPKHIRPKKPLPEVPKHRHGRPYVSVPSPAATTDAIKGNGNSVVMTKAPPKPPPPRRKGRLKATVESETSTPLS
ncbi:hypothetical protein F4778DRAFT_752636 [Xylariomycetidae sp. FL2044]|nr:hypothetical protein F4778DRAFT_752636 [Xylariomycetidae sp. FL2044]